MNSKNDRFKLTPEQKKTEANKALAEYRAREEAINKNTERLRALRLAREAEQALLPPTAVKPKPVKGRAKTTSAPAKPATLSEFLKRQAESGRGT